MSKRVMSWLGLAALLLLSACNATSPSGAEAVAAQSGTATQGIDTGVVGARSWGPETPPFNVEVILRGASGFGHVEFRQPNDDAKIVYLDTWVRGLQPSTHYQLQRAVDPAPDGNCTSAQWLTLGKGPVPQDIVTDETGTGREELWRSLAAIPTGTKFDIHFRVIEAATGAVALESGCYQFVVDM